MNILICPLKHATNTEQFFCPECHSQHHCKHGTYTRKGFHIRLGIISIPIKVQRYCCLNKECPRRTYSVLAPMVLRYNRFFWPCLLFLARMSRDTNSAMSALGISPGVARRAAIALAVITSWVKELYREVTDGKTGKNLGGMVKVIVGKIGYIEISNRWYRYRYPRRFPASEQEQHNLFMINDSAML